MYAKNPTIHRRPNGSFTVVQSIWDPDAQAFVRKSLGTYRQLGEAEAVRDQASLPFSTMRDEAHFERLTVAELMAWWLEVVDRRFLAGEIARRTASDYRGVALRYVIRRLGPMRVGHVTTGVVAAWILDLRGADLSSRTVRKAYGVLRMAFDESPLRRNPAAELPRSKRPSTVRERPIARPSPEAVAEFLDHVEGCDGPTGRRYLALWRVAAEHGLRRGELCGLAWEDVDLGAGTLQVVRSIGQEAGEAFVKDTKSAAGRRTHDLTPSLRVLLRVHRSAQLAERVLAGSTWTDPLGLDLGFRSSPNGGLVRPDRLTDHFRREWRRCAGLHDRVSLHGLRHTNGSILLAAGVPLADVAAHLGIDLQTAVQNYLGELDEPRRRREVASAMRGMWPD